ncbi:MAG TPA: hypothetical protein VN495_02335 [Candidatus Paceibacterota bacterium]|nr:hypothetical protein [Candidatus Paceibacterota bacterium]
MRSFLSEPDTRYSVEAEPVWNTVQRVTDNRFRAIRFHQKAERLSTSRVIRMLQQNLIDMLKQLRKRKEASSEDKEFIDGIVELVEFVDVANPEQVASVYALMRVRERRYAH